MWVSASTCGLNYWFWFYVFGILPLLGFIRYRMGIAIGLKKADAIFTALNPWAAYSSSNKKASPIDNRLVYSFGALSLLWLVYGI
jgi:hypothetical protein